MLFSILIANYNNGQYFKNCYDSIISQTYIDWEVIIVDDGSTDNSIEIIEQLISNNSKFKLYQNEKNYGCGYTKRKSIDLANGEICGFLDPDDMLEPNALEEMVLAHKQNPYASLIYSNNILLNEDLSKNFQPAEKKNQVQNGDLKFINSNGEIGHFSTFKRKMYSNTSGISAYLKRAVDQDLYLKLYEQGYVVFLDKFLYKYRIHNKGISTLENKKLARYWYWVVIMETSKRRSIDFENEFAESFLLPDECWITRQEANKNPFRIFKKLFQTIINKMKK